MQKFILILAAGVIALIGGMIAYQFQMAEEAPPQTSVPLAPKV